MHASMQRLLGMGQHTCRHLNSWADAGRWSSAGQSYNGRYTHFVIENGARRPCLGPAAASVHQL